LWLGGVGGLAQWWIVNRKFRAAPLREAFFWFYLAPLGLWSVVYCGVVGLEDWSILPLASARFYLTTFISTPPLLYLACLGHACLCAGRAHEKPPSPLGKPK